MKKNILLINLIVLITYTFAQNTQPIPIADSASTFTQDWVEIPVLVNDYDNENDDFIIWDVESPRHGTSSFNDSIIYYRSGYFVGNDTLKYKIIDDGEPFLLSDWQYVYITVFENSNIPFAQNDSITTLTQERTFINVLQNDYDANYDLLRIKNISQSPRHGNAIIFNDSTLLYRSDTTFTGLDTIKYIIMEDTTQNGYYSNEAKVFITVEENPEIPVTIDDSASTSSLVPIVIHPLINDYDPDGDDIQIENVISNSNSEIEIINDTLIKYTPHLFTGQDSIKYYVSEKGVQWPLTSNWSTVYITVNENPDIPVGYPDTLYATEYTQNEFNPLLNDFDPQNEQLEIYNIKDAYCFVSFEDSTISIMPISVTGSFDSVYYRVREVNDTLIYSDWIKIYLYKQSNPEIPQTVDDYIVATAGIPIEINVLKNDLNPSNDSIKAQIPASYQSLKGDAELLTDSIIRYTPFLSSEGIDTVLYALQTPQFELPVQFGKVIIDIQSSHSYNALDINNIKAGANSFGTLFQKFGFQEVEGFLEFNNPDFEAPIGSGHYSIYNASAWISGLSEPNNSNTIHFAGERFRQLGSDYWPGPISDIYDSDYDLKWNGLWKLHRNEINYHIAHYQDPGYEPIYDIATWPGNGNIELGQAAKLAPFYDINNNNIYEPMEGDYPLIRGDQAIYMIYNDDKFEHTESGGKKLGVQIECMLYAFEDPTDSALYNTIFAHYDIINRSDTTYYDTYIGSFADIDIGYSWDDYIGCDVHRGLFYGYNGKSIDGGGEVIAYGEHPPAQGVTILGGPLMDYDNTDNPAGECNESVNGFNFGNDTIDDEEFGMTRFTVFTNSSGKTGDPTTANEYHNYMLGFWKDSTYILYGGNGHFSSSAPGPQCRFVYPDNSDSCNWGTNTSAPNGGYNQNGKFWNEYEANNISNDMRGVGVSGPFTFKPGDVQHLDIAYTFARDYNSNDPFASVELLKQRVDSLREYISTKNILELPEILNINNHSLKEQSIKIYPNPVRYGLINIKFDNEHTNSFYYITDIYGRIMSSGTLSKGEKHYIKVTGLKSGIYILSIVSNNIIYHKKFIMNN